MRLSIGYLTTGLAFWHCAHSMRSRVYKTVRCPSVSLSHQSNAAAACGGFAAERRTRKRYRSTAPGSSSAAGGAARRSTANAGNVMLTAELTRLKVMAAYCLVYGVIHFTSLAGWLPVHWDELWAQRSVTSTGKLYLYRGRSKMKNNERGTIW